MSKLVIGVTGGIGCGMTTVANFFKNLGAVVFNGDLIAREIMQPGKPAYNAVVKHFGKEILNQNQEINREKLGDIVFGDRNKLDLLNKLVHPYWKEEVELQINKWKHQADSSSIAVLDAAIILEADLLELIDKLVVVYAPLDVRKQRIHLRNGLEEYKIEQRINSQLPLEEKMKKADYIIDNSGSLTATYKQVLNIWKDVRSSFK